MNKFCHKIPLWGLLLVLCCFFSCSKDETDNRLALYGLSAHYKGAMLYRIGEGNVSDSVPVSCTLKPGNGYMELVLDTVPLDNLVREALKNLPPETTAPDRAWFVLYNYVIAVNDTGWLYNGNVEIQLYPDMLKREVESDSVHVTIETPGDALYIPGNKRLDFSLIASEVRYNGEKLPLPPVQCWFELVRYRSLSKEE